MKLLMALLLCVSFAQAIITIAPVEIGTKPGISGKLSASLQTKRGNTDKDEYSAGLRIQYDSNTSYLFWGDIIGSYGEASGETNTNKFYTHLRYLHTVNIDNLIAEAFIQSEGNEFTSVKRRRLAGGGLRYKLSDSDFGKFFFGLGAFYENIAYTTDIDPEESNARINSYISYTKEFGDKSKIAYVGYYQPNTEDFNDAVISNGLELKIHIVEKLYITVQIYYDIDTDPAIGVEDTDFTQKTLFIWEF
jgi:putative salt-induced outer membrane protein